MNKIIKVLLFAIFVNQIQSIDFQDCGSTTGTVTSITVSGCPPTSQSCDFKTGTDVSIDAQFQSKTDSNTATVKVWGIIGGVPVPFNLQPSNACVNWNIKCPISTGGKYDLNITVPILKKYPRISVEVRLALLDSNNNKLLCQQFPAKIE